MAIHGLVTQSSRARAETQANVHHSGDFVVVPTPFAEERINLIDKDDRGLHFPSEREERRDELVRLSEPVNPAVSFLVDG